jgi:midasin (ATPase involved in ribosome maturation)
MRKEKMSHLAKMTQSLALMQEKVDAQHRVLHDQFPKALVLVKEAKALESQKDFNAANKKYRVAYEIMADALVQVELSENNTCTCQFEKVTRVWQHYFATEGKMEDEAAALEDKIIPKTHSIFSLLDRLGIGIDRGIDDDEDGD